MLYLSLQIESRPTHVLNIKLTLNKDTEGYGSFETETAYVGILQKRQQHLTKKRDLNEFDVRKEG